MLYPATCAVVAVPPVSTTAANILRISDAVCVSITRTPSGCTGVSGLMIEMGTITPSFAKIVYARANWNNDAEIP
ncbi:hypothetical protein PAN31117_04530 [Pandoraea anapnoica]|uniref:Uncharacterized protein n=1 Tax=Pandoraea anapnoica TaxID=2508301 RepID=A0A5E5AJV7_9BURK|nr:hypothetical protein PAN31117_04530 [Pandoraea anapnoica]